MRFLVVDSDPRARAAWTKELSRGSAGPDELLAVADAAEAHQALATLGSHRVVAFLAWPIDAASRPLLTLLRSIGAYVVAMLPRSRWESAVDAQREGADDILLTPCPPQMLGVRALVAREAVRRARPAPWHRPRVALRAALAHEAGGEVVVVGPSSSARIVVSRGRVAWVHDEADRLALVDRLRDFGVRVSADELAAVVAECQKTREHLADVLARWGLAERETALNAMRGIVDSRLGATLARRDGAALFIPARWGADGQDGFTADELGVAPATIPPPDLETPHAWQTAVDPELRARCEALAEEVFAIEGCVAALVLHQGSATVVSARGGVESLGVGWTLGAALDAVDDPRADVFASTADRCHVARRIPGEADCFVYAALDLETTSLALARRSVVSVVERFAVSP